MKAQYQHELMTSFLLWFDNQLLQKGEAYSNQTGVLYYSEDSRLPSSFKSYSSSYKQWVTDSSISGDVNPIIPTSFNGYDRSDDLIFDFDNGRIIETGGNFQPEQVLTGTFAVKDFNVYFTNETEDTLIIDNEFQLNSRYGDSFSGVPPYDEVMPAVFLNCEYMRNEGFAFGGEDKTTNTIKGVVFAENSYQLDGVLSIFADSARKTIVKIPFSGFPSTEYGDLKNGSYNYIELSNTYLDSNPYYINDVTVSKFSEKTTSKIPQGVKIGFIDFEVCTSRFPRS
jgi:hypothetical protein